MQPKITLNNGHQIPALGLGTWQSASGVVQKIVKEAIKSGYRHIDCAYIYENETEIGDAIQECIAEKIVTRDELFVTTKLWNTFHRCDLVIPTCKMQLDSLKLDYVDLYLIHWPFGYKENTSELFPVNEKGKVYGSDVDYIETWKEMEKCVHLGLAKSIGLSNFNSEQITRLLTVASIKPVMNQVEVHPMLNQKKLISFCKERGIAITAYSPFGSPTRPWFKDGDTVLDLNDAKLVKIGGKYNKSPTQVILRYLVDIGTIPIPKSSNIERVRENINIFDFELTSEDVDVIDGFNCNARVCPAEGMESHKYYPFHIDF